LSRGAAGAGTAGTAAVVDATGTAGTAAVVDANGSTNAGNEAGTGSGMGVAPDVDMAADTRPPVSRVVAGRYARTAGWVTSFPSGSTAAVSAPP